MKSFWKTLGVGSLPTLLMALLTFDEEITTTLGVDLFPGSTTLTHLSLCCLQFSLFPLLGAFYVYLDRKSNLTKISSALWGGISTATLQALYVGLYFALSTLFQRLPSVADAIEFEQLSNLPDSTFWLLLPLPFLGLIGYAGCMGGVGAFITSNFFFK